MTEAAYLKRSPRMGWSEWVNGKIVLFPPPSLDHAVLSSFFLCLIGGFVDDSELGRVLRGSYQLRLREQRSRRSPDLFFVSNERASIVREQNLEGAPDLILEIISPDSQSRDRREKYLEYERAGVREYWIVDPISRSVEAYALGSDSKLCRIEITDGMIRSKVLKGFYLKPEWLWRVKLPKVSSILREIKRKR